MRAHWTHSLGLATLVALTLGGCRSTINAEDAPSRSADSQIHKIASTYFQNPMLSHVSISPDGRNIVAILAREGSEVLITKPTYGKEIRSIAKLERTRHKSSMRVRTLGWAGNTHLVASVEMPHFTARRVRARQTRLMVVPLQGGNPKYIGEKWRYQEYMGFQDNVISWLHDDPDHILLALWMPDQNGASARKVDIRTGALSLVARPRTGTTHWAADHEGNVRAGWGEARGVSNNFLVSRTEPRSSFIEIARWDPSEEEGLHFAGYSEDSETIYVYKRTEAGRLGLYTYDLESRKLGSLVWAHPEYDISMIVQSKQDDRLLAIGYVSDRPEIHVIDDEYVRIHDTLAAALPDRTNRIVSTDHAERLAIVESSSDMDPPTYYLLEIQKRKLTKLFDAYPKAEKEFRFSAMEPIEYAARDGLPIHGYLALPGTGQRPYPTIVIPHGGPWARDVWGWDPLVQFLTRRGFAVLQPNFRGSQGYGYDFEERGIGRWGLEMQDDISDGVDWLVAEGIADPRRVGIYGSSYGGFAALYALVKEPDRFKAGASFAGVTDVLTMLGDDKSYWGLLDDMQRLVGHRWKDRRHLKSISPALNADKSRAPVLIAHGTEDWRVHVKQAHAMIDALEDAGVEVESHLYDGEIHGFLDERNRIDFYAKLAAFFERHLMEAQPAPSKAAAESP
jgi:dipeptidyl aminopeptidase/acylaminoacyl peptidase